MAAEADMKFIEETVTTLLADDPTLFLVAIKIKPINNIKVFLDGDEGITIERCSKINRVLYKRLEEEKIFPNDDFSLEISSPGIDEPLIMHRQYVKNIDRLVEVKTNSGEVLVGDLKAVNENNIELEVTTGKGKKMEIKQCYIAFDNIKSTIVQIKF